MSQVSFKIHKNNKEIEVVGGYDQGTNSFHLTVFDLESDNDDVLYDNLSDKDMFPTSVDPLIEVLERLGINVPSEFWSHCRLKEGNVLYKYEDGMWNKYLV